MAVSIDDILSRIKASGILTPTDLESVRSELAASKSDEDAENFIKRLHKQGRITAYQAQALWKDKADKLAFGNYVIEEELGRGGMGVVLKARHKRMQRYVAIKVLPAKFVKDKDAIARFQREVVAASKLEHQNIVGAYDADEVNGQHILVMQFVDGQDLSTIVKKQGPLTVAHAIDCVIQTARGLEFAHHQGVIHRDIKPANLLLDTRGTVKILDMGLARFSDTADVGTQAELTGSGTIMGTVDYMSPEQALSTKTADARSDIYSLGITLYYLLTGQPAYTGDSLMARMMAHANRPIPDLSASRPGVPGSVNAVFAKMVAKQPDDRYQSMTEVIAALESVRPSSSPLTPSAAGPAESVTAELRSGIQAASAVTYGNPTQTAVASEISTAETPTMISGIQPGQDQTIVHGAGSDQRQGPWGARRQTKANHRIWIPAAGGASLLLGALLIVVLSSGGGPDKEPTPTSGGGSPDTVSIASIAPGTSQSKTPVLPAGTASSDSPEFALSFDGTGNVTIPSITYDPAQPITMEAWVNLQPTDSDRSLLTLTAPNHRIKIQQGAASGNFFHFGAALGPNSPPELYVVNSAQPIPQNWTHVAICQTSPTTFVAYINGVPEVRELWRLTNTTGSKFELNIGSSTGASLLGEVDEVRISRGVRYPGPFTPIRRFEPDGQTIALYHFDEGSGTVVRDASGNNFHGTLNGGTWQRLDDGANSSTWALRFDGVDNYVDGETLAATGWKELTLEAWVTPDEYSSERGMTIASWSPLSMKAHDPKLNGDWVTVWRNESGRYQGVSNGLDRTISRQKVHVAFVADDKGARLFVNGKPSGVRPWEDVGGPLWDVLDKNLDSRITLAAADVIHKNLAEAQSTGLFQGLYYEFRVSRRVRYRESFVPDASWPDDEDTVVHYRFDEGHGDIVRDTSGNNHHGKIVGAKWVRFDGVEHTAPRQAVASPSKPTPYEILTSPNYEWTEPENLGPGVNTNQIESYPALSADGLRLIYHSYGRGGHSLCEATRSSVTEPFGFGEPLGPEFGNKSARWGTAISGDGLTLVFGSDRSGGSGGPDLWQATRPTLTSPFGKPACLTSLNSSDADDAPTLASDGLTIWFRSTRPGFHNTGARWTSRRPSLNAEFEQPVPLVLPLLPGAKHYPTVYGTAFSPDERVLIFSPVLDEEGSRNLYQSVRSTSTAPFGVPVDLGLSRTSAASDTAPTLSADGTVLVFVSERPGGFGMADLWMTRRVPKGNGTAVSESPNPRIVHGGKDTIAKITTSRRWPLTPSKPEEIRWLHAELAMKLTLRSGANDDLSVRNDQKLPSEPSTIVGIIFHRDSGPKVTDEVLRRIASLPDLEALEMDFSVPGPNVTREGLSALGTLEHLEKLSLGRCGTANADYDFLTRLPKLRSLRLSLLPFPNWVDRVKTIRTLQQVSLNVRDISRLEELKDLPELVHLELSGSADDLKKRRERAVEVSRAIPWLQIILTTSGTSDVEVFDPIAPRTATPSPAIAPFDAAQAKAHQEAWAKYLGTTVETTNAAGMKMILIPPGEYTMGLTDEESAALETWNYRMPLEEFRQLEQPAHRVVISKPFRISATEVTVGQFQQFAATGYQTLAERRGGTPLKSFRKPDGEQTAAEEFPVSTVSWDDAAAFCTWLSQQPGNARARLPTDAEWEYACRAGTTTHFHFGNEVKQLPDYGWFSVNSERKHHPVGQKRPNPFGLYDMHGGVLEWCSDFFAPFTNSNSPQIDPTGPTTGTERVIRSGHPFYGGDQCRSSTRKKAPPGELLGGLGFRIVEEITLPAGSAIGSSSSTEGGKSARTIPAPQPLPQKNSETAPSPAIAPFDATQAKAHQEAWAKHLGTTVETTNTVGQKLILIPPGEFMMGNSDADIEQLTTVVKEQNDGNKQWIPEHARKNSTPQHRVTLTKPFLLAATEVTVAQFRQFIEETKYQTDAEKYGFGNSGGTRLDDSRVDPKSKGLNWLNPGYAVTDDQPVSQVTPKDAEAYCEWLSRKEGALYALPTEAEWEFACRAGTTTPHYFGADYSRYAAYEWCHKNARDRPQPVATKLPNPFGLFDMSGNLTEYCADIYDSPVYASRPASVIDPVVTGPGTTRVQRGQSWLAVPYELRCSFRFGGGWTSRYFGSGLRVARRWNTTAPARQVP